MVLFGKFISLLLLPLIGIIIYSVLRGYFLRDVPIWTFEVSIFIYGILGMLGAGYCHLNKKHVAIDVVHNYMSPRWRRYFELYSEAVVLFATVIILYISVPAAWRSTLLGERSIHQTPFNPPVWWYRWVIPMSCSLIIMASLKRTFGVISRIRKGDN